MAYFVSLQASQPAAFLVALPAFATVIRLPSLLVPLCLFIP